MKEKKIQDTELVRQIRKGSKEAFEEIVSRYESKIYNLAMRFTRNPEDAEEVLQDVFTTLFLKIDGFEGKSAFSSWLYRIIVNAAFMKLRKRKQQVAIPLDDLPVMSKIQKTYREPTSKSLADELTITKEMQLILQSAIARLPERYRVVFILRDIDGLPNNQVGEILNLSTPAVKSRLHRARLMLQKKLHLYYTEYTGKKIEPVKLSHSNEKDEDFDIEDFDDIEEIKAASGDNK